MQILITIIVWNTRIAKQVNERIDMRGHFYRQYLNWDRESDNIKTNTYGDAVYNEALFSIGLSKYEFTHLFAFYVFFALMTLDYYIVLTSFNKHVRTI